MTEIADLKIDKSATFPKLTLDARLYKSVLNKSVFAFHLRSAFTTEDSQFYERYYLGGSNSLRGYGDRRLTPEGWGTKLIYTNTEFRFPLESKNFPYHKSTGVVFFDAGGLWQSGQKISMDDFFAAFGIGFRVKLPVVGITRFDFAFPLTEIDRNDYKFHITLGHTF